jgi:hypothetical protein
VWTRAVSRAGSYGSYGNALYQNMKLDLSYLHGHVEGRRVLGMNEDHCHDSVYHNEAIPGCIELAELGWMPLTQVVPLGGATCRGNCLCTIETRR